MSQKEFQKRGSPMVKKMMLSSWGASASLCILAFSSPLGSIKNGRMVLMLSGVLVAFMAFVMTLVYWSTIMAKPPLDPDGRMPLPKEPKPEERWK